MAKRSDGDARVLTGRPVQAVLFDFDGTLGKYRSHLGLYVLAASEVGVAITEAALAEALDAGWRRWETPQGVDHSAHSGSEKDFRSIRRELHVARLEAAGAVGDLEAAAERICELESDAASVTIYEDTLPALERLCADGIPVVVVSNHVWALPEMVELLGLDRYIAHVLTSARVGYRKPHPKMYAAAIEAASVPPSELLFVGDNWQQDVLGPRAMGMQALLLDRSGVDAGDNREALVIRSLLEVPRWLHSAS